MQHFRYVNQQLTDIILFNPFNYLVTYAVTFPLKK